jgi:hypothetical protein
MAIIAMTHVKVEESVPVVALQIGPWFLLSGSGVANVEADPSAGSEDRRSYRAAAEEIRARCGGNQCSPYAEALLLNLWQWASPEDKPMRSMPVNESPFRNSVAGSGTAVFCRAVVGAIATPKFHHNFMVYARRHP